MWSNISKKSEYSNMSFMLLSHVLASLCLYTSSKAMHSYIPNPCGTPSVYVASFFQVVSLLVISFPSGSSQCGAKKVKRITPPPLPEVGNDQKTTSDIYKW
jgi:hypothetical protein